jgi:hypothetical protein
VRERRGEEKEVAAVAVGEGGATGPCWAPSGP